MKRLLCISLAFVCLLGLAGCRYNETVKVEYGEAALYTGGDIGMTITYVDPATETVKCLVENRSEYELIYGQPFLSFARKTLGGWKHIEQDPNWAYTAEGYTLAPGESVELEASTERYLARLDTEKSYRVCFEFWYAPEDSEADGDNFQNTPQRAYLVHDFVIPDEVA